MTPSNVNWTSLKLFFFGVFAKTKLDSVVFSVSLWDWPEIIAAFHQPLFWKQRELRRELKCFIKTWFDVERWHPFHYGWSYLSFWEFVWFCQSSQQPRQPRVQTRKQGCSLPHLSVASSLIPTQTSTETLSACPWPKINPLKKKVFLSEQTHKTNKCDFWSQDLSHLSLFVNDLRNILFYFVWQLAATRGLVSIN